MLQIQSSKLVTIVVPDGLWQTIQMPERFIISVFIRTPAEALDNFSSIFLPDPYRQTKRRPIPSDKKSNAQTRKEIDEGITL